MEDARQPGQREHDGSADMSAGGPANAPTDSPTRPLIGAQAETPAAAPAAPPGAAPAAPPGAASTAAPGDPLAETPAQTPVSAAAEVSPGEPGFLDRGRMRRRARFLRAARELAYRDLGGLIFDLHRFGQRNDEVVTAKLDTLARIDTELRAHEAALREHRPVTVLREAGVAACPRCAAIHGSGDRFCPACGLPVDQAERPIATHSAVPAPSARSPISQPIQPAPAIAPPPPAPQQAAQAAMPAAPASNATKTASGPAIHSETSASDATPAAPTPAPSEQATEVIRAAPPPDGTPAQRTVAFDPLSQPAATPSPPQDAQEQESRRP